LTPSPEEKKESDKVSRKDSKKSNNIVEQESE
jgi:hypothetical protein